MGIPGLQRRLEPYSEFLHLHRPPTFPASQPSRNELGNPSVINSTGEISPVRTISAVIDGPGLAYHAYNIACSKSDATNSNLSRLRDSSSQPQPTQNWPHRPSAHQTSRLQGGATPGPNATPSCADVIRVLLTWLDELTAPCVSDDRVHVQINVESIIFDGALPESKREEREGRLKARVAQLVQCKLLNSGSNHIENYGTDKIVDREDLNTRHVNSKSQRLPFPPWIASATFEGLKNSKWADLTLKVPGEADPYCAGAASCHSDMVLIFTSDSDLLAYDVGAAAVVFFKDVEFTAESLQLQTYLMSEIARRLSKSKSCSPTIVAYCISQDVYISDRKLANTARDVQQDPVPSLEAFRKRYRNKVLGMKSDKAVEILDTPLSELYFSSRSDEMQVYLPILQEDPTRASAWRISTTARQAAYSLLLYPSHALVYEVLRRGNGIGRIAVHCTEDLLDQILGIRDGISTMNFRLLATRHLLMFLSDESKPLPGFQELLYLLTGTFVANWDYIQNLAQIQAIMYSYRMLLQATTVFLARNQESTPLVEQCKVLHDCLNDLGCARLSNIFDPIAQSDSIQDAARKLCDKFNIEQLPLQGKKVKRDNITSPKQKENKSSNPYDILDEE